MKYFLDDLVVPIASVAESMVEFGGHAPNYIEEFRVLERALQRLYPNDPDEKPAFGAALILQTTILTLAAVERLQRRLDQRAEKHRRIAEMGRQAATDAKAEAISDAADEAARELNAIVTKSAKPKSH